MPTLKPVGRIEVHAERGLARFQLTDGKQVYDVELPVDPFLIFAGRLYQEMLRGGGGSIRGSDNADRKPVMLPAEFEVGTLQLRDNPCVVLVMDGGTPAEISLAIPVHKATDVGDALGKRANEIIRGLSKT